MNIILEEMLEVKFIILKPFANFKVASIHRNEHEANLTKPFPRIQTQAGIGSFHLLHRNFNGSPA
jgi:hypothetical protein